jgi:hypothetical protein
LSSPIGPSTPSFASKSHGQYWLHLGQGWRFFAPENFITRLTAVLDAETHVFQVEINLADAVALTGTSAAERAAAGPQTASLEEVICIRAV